MYEIVAVRYGEHGISDVKFQDGTTASLEQAVELAKQKKIKDVTTGATRGDDYHETIKSRPDNSKELFPNLADLPRF